MPVYEYRCERGHLFDVVQRMTDDPLTTCTECESPVQRVFHPVAVHFKGSGFYSTDYGRAASGSGNEKGASEGSSGSDGTGKESGGEKKDADGKAKEASTASPASAGAASD
jgi:putative FmdB family regulatory protein